MKARLGKFMTSNMQQPAYALNPITEPETSTLSYTTLSRSLADYKSPRFEYLPSFTGGLVGYFAYDYQGYKEPAAKTAVQHRQYPIFEVQFHPESIMTPDGKTMLRNFINHKP